MASYMHKDYKGQLCYYATGLQEGGQHDGLTLSECSTYKQDEGH